MSQSNREKVNSPFHCPFVLVRHSTNEMMTSHFGKSHLLYSIQMIISSGHTLTATPRSNLLSAIWEALRPLMLPHDVRYPSQIPTMKDLLVLLGMGRRQINSKF
jgi:hypothetical protein